MSLTEFAKEKKNIFWSTNNYEGLSKEAVIEGVLNYGDMKDIKELCIILDIKEIAQIFKEQANKVRSNYRPEIKNYFTLYFNKYA